jgi:hypothetical protein
MMEPETKADRNLRLGFSLLVATSLLALSGVLYTFSLGFAPCGSGPSLWADPGSTFRMRASAVLWIAAPATVGMLVGWLSIRKRT